VNPVAAELLGWARSDIVGRRLTTIIPPEHRTAHLAGFTRYQLTGEGPLIGTTVEVPMLRRDGTVTQVRLTIDVIDVEPVGRAFRACFTALGDGRPTG
jgi:PAS domain S-box-containing protein